MLRIRWLYSVPLSFSWWGCAKRIACESRVGASRASDCRAADAKTELYVEQSSSRAAQSICECARADATASGWSTVSFPLSKASGCCCCWEKFAAVWVLMYIYSLLLLLLGITICVYVRLRWDWANELNECYGLNAKFFFWSFGNFFFVIKSSVELIISFAIICSFLLSYFFPNRIFWRMYQHVYREIKLRRDRS